VALFGMFIVFSSTFLYFVVRIRRHRKKFTFAISSLWWVSCFYSNTIGLFAKGRAITPFKVIQGHRRQYQSKARTQLAICD